jgi:hypothetical protein
MHTPVLLGGQPPHGEALVRFEAGIGSRPDPWYCLL